MKESNFVELKVETVDGGYKAKIILPDGVPYTSREIFPSEDAAAEHGRKCLNAMLQKLGIEHTVHEVH